ncbi:MAG: inositol monophosphatase family protein [Candidatus Latescibacteria bacterium]|nr:inositol monophosphatase family protein [Candidatus Latescibacterota bacterium]
MHNIDTAWLLNITQKAGDIALRHFGQTEGTLKPDNSWVTQADLDVEAYLRSELEKARPHDAILGEEGDDPPPASPVVWAIDPIDGTRVFNHGLPVWGVSIGALVEGIPTIGAFILPALGDIYYTDGTTAYLNKTPLTPPEPKIDPNAILLVSEGAFDRVSIQYAGKVINLGSAAANLCYVARGSAIGAVDQANIWDYAAGAAILRVLDVPFTYLSGNEVDFTALYTNHAVTEPTLICPRQHFETLQAAIVELA